MMMLIILTVAVGVQANEVVHYAIIFSQYLLRLTYTEAVASAPLFWKNLFLCSPLIWRIKFDTRVLMQRVKLIISLF